MNEFLLLVIVIIYLAIKPPSQRADEDMTASQAQEKSSEAWRAPAHRR